MLIEATQSLGEADYLLGVCDETRQGALRFRFEADGPFQAPSGPHAVPPLVDLPRLLSSSERVSRGDADSDDLRLLLAPGSSMGGARPKACIRDRSGELVLAKFPRNSDELDVVRWEAVALKLAQRAGIPVPPHRLELVAGRAVLLVSRFDRRGAARVPFLSAMSMLGAVDNEPHSYLEIADALRLYGAQPRHDLKQLWRRIVFGVLINNTDDHLRNHGFLYQAANGWVLSPAYDLNPMPVDLAPRALTTAIDLDDPTASLKLVLSTAVDYGLSKERGVAVIQEVVAALEGWVAVAKACGLKNSQIERMRSAFEHPERML
jgi:serine/threonine-protein kinase HipA